MNNNQDKTRAQQEDNLIGGYGLEVCQRLVEEGRSKGLDDIEVYYQRLKSLEVVIEKNDLQLPKSDIYQGVGIRVFKNGSMGFASTNDLDENSLKLLMKQAAVMAENSPPDRNNRLPEAEKLEEVPDIYDDRAENIQLGDLIESARSFMKEIKQDDRVTVDTAGFSASIVNDAIATSRGIISQDRQTYFETQALALAREGEEVSSFDMEYQVSCFYEELDVAESGRKLRDKVLASLGADTIESFRGEILLTPFSAVTLLVRPLVFAVNSENVQNGISPWKDKSGKQVAADILTVIDDGTLPGGVGSGKFDREGLPQKRLTVIKDGHLQELFYNAYTAARAGRNSNGRAGGGAQSTPDIAPSNFMVSGGKKSRDELISEIERGLLVNRYSGSVDPVSGDFSGVVKGGQLIDRGCKVKPVREVMISGNIYQMLQKIAGLSREREDIMNFKLPYVLLEDVSITCG